MPKFLSPLLLLVCLACSTLAAQGTDFFRPASAPASSILTELRPIVPSQAFFSTALTDALPAHLQSAPAENMVDLAVSPTLLTLPTPTGESVTFRIVRYRMISASVAAAFPELVTAYGLGQKDPRLVVYLDWGYQGFHATVTGDAAGKWSVDPVWRNDQSTYQSYYHKDHLPTAEVEMTCGTDATDYLPPTAPPVKSVGDCQLRQYDLALACTGEYYDYFTSGTNDAIVFSAMMTAVNRVNQVFRQDLAITLTLINENNGGNIELLYDNPATDPYTNSDQGLMINENQINIDNVIGTAGYDIGHLFSTNGGGFASLGSVCNPGQKARAVTGSPVPVGDPFLIDLVAHEMGHQFGAAHSFNSTVSNCNQRNASTAYEPGSGTTIMAYAGICASANVQFDSDPYYHAISIQQIAAYMETGNGNSCATKTTNNLSPSVNAGSNYTIPRNTPFTLTAMGSDGNNDPLTYCWEQFDLGPAVANMPTGNETAGPLFRSFPPTGDPSRTFPNLSGIISGNTPWESLPLVSRNLSFVVTARDVNANYGCAVQDQTEITVANAGPFRVTVPNGGENWVANSTRTITWNVAGTTGNGINTTNVRIDLSLDGGFTYPLTLLNSTPNDGSQQITVPDITENNARIRISAVGNVYFDISDNDFAIERTDFTLEIDEATVTECAGTTSAQFGFSVRSVMGFNGAVTLSTSGLPGGVNRTFSPSATITPPTNGSTNVLLNLSGTSNLAVGSYSFTLIGTFGSRTKTETLTLVIEAKPTSAPTNLIPAPGGSVPANMQSFSWDAVPGADAYQFRICPNPGGAGGGCAIANVSNTSVNFGSNLPYGDGETAYWQVIAFNVNCPSESTASPLQQVNFGTVPTGASLSSNNSPRTICQGTNSTTFQVGFTNGALTGPATLTILSTTLPGGATTSVSPGTINNGGSATVSVGNLAGVARGTYTITVRAAAGGNTETLELQLIIEGIPINVTLLTPINGQPADRTQPIDFDWTNSPEADNYLIEFDLNPALSSPDFGFNTSISAQTVDFGGTGTVTVYWRVTTTGACGTVQSAIQNFTLTDDQNVLPVEWLTFTARPENGTAARLDWSVIQDGLGSGFGIERRDGETGTFRQLAWILDNGIIGETAYTELDALPATGQAYYYRLRQEDRDGAVSYSPIRSVSFKGEEISSAAIVPNPAGPVAEVVLTGPLRAQTYRIVDQLGRTLRQGQLTGSRTALNLANLPAAVYQVVLEGEGYREVLRVVKR